MIGTFMEVGLRHILSLSALDHLLFLLALAAGYRLRDWRHGLWVVSAFTVGHSLTLALVSMAVVQPPVALVEFLIPCTIVAAAAENFWGLGEHPTGWDRPLLALVFGLVHGAGFASTLAGLFDGGIILPLLGFNLGIEIGQLLVLATLVLTLTIVDAAVTRLRPVTPRPSTDWRTITTSALVAGCGVILAATSVPW